MVLAIETCHKLGFIHRDIKPDVGIFPAYMETETKYSLFPRHPPMATCCDMIPFTSRISYLTLKDISNSPTLVWREFRILMFEI